MNRSKRFKSIWQISKLIVLIVGFISLTVCSEKPQQKKVYKIGILCGLDYLTNVIDGFKTDMTGLLAQRSGKHPWTGCSAQAP